MSAMKFLGQKEVPIGDLKPHPDNPNRGSVPDLSNSLEEFGQFRSLPVWKDPDGGLTILAGHHLVEAAKELGIETMRVDVIDTDDKTARKIMLADNRLADLGLGPDLDLLLKNLEELSDDIAGTGFDVEYIKMLEEAVSGPPEIEELDDEANETPASPEDFYRRLTLLVDPKLATKWEAIRKLYPDDTSALASIIGEEQESAV